MPFKGNRVFILAGIVLFIVIIVIAAAASSASNAANKAKTTPTPAPTPIVTPGPPPTVSFTVNSVVGISSISVTNQNTGAKMTLIPAELPHTYTVNYGDTLTFKVTSMSGYRFNMWIFGDSTFHSPEANGYLTVKITNPLIMEPHFLIEVSP